MVPQVQTAFNALMSAASKGHTDCVRLLVEVGADTNAKDRVRAGDVMFAAAAV